MNNQLIILNFLFCFAIKFQFQTSFSSTHFIYCCQNLLEIIKYQQLMTNIYYSYQQIAARFVLQRYEARGLVSFKDFIADNTLQTKNVLIQKNCEHIFLCVPIHILYPYPNKCIFFKSRS